MALVMEDSDICSNWEDIEENSDILDKQLARLKLEKSKREEAEGILVKNNNLDTGNGTDKMMKNSANIVLDSTTQESLRTQYAPPEPKMTILARPKDKEANNSHNRKSHSDNKTKNVASKSLQQREQEYAEARMRILGDVRFEAEEAEVAEAPATPTLSPAEILKLKVAEAVRGDADLSSSTTPNLSSSTNLASSAAGPGSGVENNNVQYHHQQQPGHVNGPHNGPGRGGGRNKRSREKPKIKTTNPETTRDFPVHKTDSEFIHRHPRGPDGTTGFQFKRT